MNIVIMSQGKTTLVQPEAIVAINNIIRATTDKYIHDIGNYETPEQAHWVLDQIGGKFIYYENVGFYQMPTIEEVKEAMKEKECKA